MRFFMSENDSKLNSLAGHKIVGLKVFFLKNLKAFPTAPIFRYWCWVECHYNFWFFIHDLSVPSLSLFLQKAYKISLCPQYSRILWLDVLCSLMWIFINWGTLMNSFKSEKTCLWKLVLNYFINDLFSSISSDTIAQILDLLDGSSDFLGFSFCVPFLCFCSNFWVIFSLYPPIFLLSSSFLPPRFRSFLLFELNL